MKIMVSNYTDAKNTEAIYFHYSLQKMGVQSALWADGSSAFDAFDTIDPDVFICSPKKLTVDILKCLNQRSNKTRVVANVTDMTGTQIKQFKTLVRNPVFLFSNVKHADVDYVPVGFDIYNQNLKTPKTKPCKKAILATHYDSLVHLEVAKNPVHHLVQITNEELEQPFDLRTNCVSLPSLMLMYEEISLVGDHRLIQSQIYQDLKHGHPKFSYISNDDFDPPELLSCVEATKILMEKI